MPWSDIFSFSKDKGRKLASEEIAQGVLNETQDAIRVEGTNAAVTGTAADAAGDPTIIGLLKQIEINTRP